MPPVVLQYDTDTGEELDGWEMGGSDPVGQACLSPDGKRYLCSRVSQTADRSRLPCEVSLQTSRFWKS